MKQISRWLSFFLLFPFFLTGCASTGSLKGISKDGSKIYLASVLITNTEAYKTFLRTPRSDVSEQTYMFSRLKLAKDLSFFHDGSWFTWLEAYRGGMWLMRNRYKKEQDTRTFLKNYVWHSEKTGKPHLIKYPDGSVHVAYYVLLNELDLLEETLKNDPAANKK